MGRGGATSSGLWGLAVAAGLTGLAFLVLVWLLRGGPAEIPSDQASHIDNALHLSWPPQLPHPLYHYSVALALDLSPLKGWEGAKLCAAFVLAIAIGFRAWLSQRELCRAYSPPSAAVATVALALAMSLPGWWNFPWNHSARVSSVDLDPTAGTDAWWWRLPSAYLGQVNPNVLHNPTAIFAAPFTLLVFLAGMCYLDAPAAGPALALGVGSALCALAKPNYLLAFMPCFLPAFVIAARRGTRDGRVSERQSQLHLLAAFAPPAAVMAWQVGQVSDEFVVAPFRVWSRYSANVPASLLLGLGFPLVVVACYPRQLLADRRAVFAWCVLAVAVAQFALLAETVRFAGANFGWGMLAGAYVLFVESCRFLGGRSGWYRSGLCYGVLALHVISGAVYLTRSLIDPADTLFF